MGTCIRAICNTDVEKAGFELGKDVSLPETNVRYPQNPLQNLGGKPPSKRIVFAFFAGKMHGYLRPILLRNWENKDPDMKIFKKLPKVKDDKNYVDYMKSSKFCICAKGSEVNSPRVVEAIFYECVPVIISDNFVPPFFEVLDWESFAVFVPEKDIPDLKNILLSIPDKRRLYKHMAACEDDAFSKLLFACCQHLRRVMAKNHTMIVNMEALGARGVALDSLDALINTHERHRVLLEKLNSLFNQAKAGVCEEESNAKKMNE
ncbi:exostosin-like protein [Artemisia annua]|uniref:Exostosin-like protein n=1 Tax=Artemisia annua TaxID=35608 RepID=A0A2U1NH77_ARTAN|nr:exostosin-like protein [Artemisia annua]